MFLRGHHCPLGHPTCFTDGKTSVTICQYPLPSVPSGPIDNVFEGPPSGHHTCFTHGKCCLTNSYYTLPSVNLTYYLNKNLPLTHGKCHTYNNYHPYFSVVLDHTTAAIIKFFLILCKVSCYVSSMYCMT